MSEFRGLARVSCVLHSLGEPCHLTGKPRADTGRHEQYRRWVVAVEHRPKTTREKRPTRPWWWVIVGIGILGVAAFLVGAFCATSTTGEWPKLWLEVAKAGVQVIAIGVAGGALTAAWKALADQREREAARMDKIRAEFAELITLYNGVKTVRRALRSLGLDAKLYLDPKEVKDNERGSKGYYLRKKGREELTAIGLGVPLTKEQADGFHGQLRILNQLQLGYEARKRQFQQADLLGEDRTKVADTLACIESYLNHLVDPWEQRGWNIHEGTLLNEVSDPLQALYRKRVFRRMFSHRMQRITKVFNEHLFGPPGSAKDKTSDSSSVRDHTKAEPERPGAAPPDADGP